MLSTAFSMAAATLALGMAGLMHSTAAAPLENELATRQSSGKDKAVFAHFMVGIVENYTVDDWKWDMGFAKEIGIDAFALNCASIDSYTPTQLANAYQAANESDFKVFISFDFSYWNNGDVDEIASYMQNYSSHPGQMQYGGAAVVSTFVGDSFDWSQVKAQVDHPIFAIPNLQDPAEAPINQYGIDGAFSWYSWPEGWGNVAAAPPMTTMFDEMFINDTAPDNLTYMMPHSSWFSTHFGSKNWIFPSEDELTVRWEQVLDLEPALVEIITWNDYGESHYIGPWEPNHKDDGSSQWAEGFPHDAWRIVAKPYIAAYKSGAKTPTVEEDQLVYWYRPTPKDVTCSNDTLGPPQYIELLSDVVFVTTLLTDEATLTVTSGSNVASSVTVPAGIVTTNFTMGVGSQSFEVKRGDTVILSGKGGKDISDSCQTYNFNAYTGSINGTSS